MRGSDLHVTVGTTFKCMVGSKSKYLQVSVRPEISTPVFLKESDHIVYAIPPSASVIDAGVNDRQHYR